MSPAPSATRPDTPGAGATPVPRGAAGTRLLAAIAAVAVLGTGAGSLVTLVVPPKAVARAEVLFDPHALQSDEPSARRAVATQLQIILGNAVLAPAAEAVGLPLDDVIAAVEAEPLVGSPVISVRVHGSDERASLRLLDAVVTGYLQVTHRAEAPETGLMRSRLLSPPSLAAGERDPSPGEGTLLGLAVGLLAGVVAAGIQALRWRPGDRG